MVWWQPDWVIEAKDGDGNGDDMHSCLEVMTWMGKEVLVFWSLGRGEIVLEISVLEMVLFRRSFDVSPSAALQGNTVVMYDVSSTEVSD